MPDADHGSFITQEGDTARWWVAEEEPDDVDRGILSTGKGCQVEAYADADVSTPFTGNALFCWRLPDHADDHYDAADDVAWKIVG